MLNKEDLVELKDWMTDDIVDDPEDIFDGKTWFMIVELIDFWLDKEDK